MRSQIQSNKRTMSTSLRNYWIRLVSVTSRSTKRGASTGGFEPFFVQIGARVRCRTTRMKNPKPERNPSFHMITFQSCHLFQNRRMIHQAVFSNRFRKKKRKNPLRASPVSSCCGVGWIAKRLKVLLLFVPRVILRGCLWSRPVGRETF